MIRKAWDYEKSVRGAQIEPKTWRILQLVSLNVGIALAIPLEVLENWQNISIHDSAYHSRFSNSKCFWSVAVGIPSR